MGVQSPLGFETVEDSQSSVEFVALAESLSAVALADHQRKPSSTFVGVHITELVWLCWCTSITNQSIDARYETAATLSCIEKVYKFINGSRSEEYATSSPWLSWRHSTPHLCQIFSGTPDYS